MTSIRFARLVLGCLASMAMLGSSACGVPADTEPRALSVDDVPYGLLDEASPAATSTTTSAPELSTVNVAVYFLLGEHLQPAPRTVIDPPTARRVLNVLFEGPTEEEAVSGLRTAINPASDATVVRSTGVVIVDLSADFAAVSTVEQRFAVAQIVFTLTGLEGISGVLFTLAGAPVGVPLPDGTVTAEPVTRDAFAALAPSARPAPDPAAPAEASPA